jgi:polyisoprenoid-binding protein YceI
MKRIALAVLLSISLLPSAALAGWNLDSSLTVARFKLSYMLFTSVQGGFDDVTGTVVYDERDVTKSSADVSIAVSSIKTGIGLRDSDLKGSRFFDAAKYPSIKFKSRKVEKISEGVLKVTGDLTLHGVTHEVVLDVAGPTAITKDSSGKERVGAKATTKLSRKDYGMEGLVGGDEVEVSIDVWLIRDGGSG